MDRPTPPEPEPEPSPPSTPEWVVKVGEWPRYEGPESFPLLSTEPPKTRPRDALAVALGNSSLLSVGYGMLGRWWLAVSTGLVTVVLVLILAVHVRAVWLEFVILGWWLALVAHGWFLARRGPRPEGGVLSQRLVAFGALLPVLLVFGIFRFDAAQIEDEVATAQGDGDCSRAMTALDRRDLGHRIADAPGTAKGDSTVRACNLLNLADQALDDALTGDTERLGNGYGELATVLREFPGHEKMVEHVLAGFLDRLPNSNACDTVPVTDWLGQRRTNNNILKRAVDSVPRIAPQAIVACADAQMGANDWKGAQSHYQQLLDEYPNHDLAAKATEGVTRATQAIELANVRSLFSSSQYCTSPAPYSAAPPIGAGPNRAAIFGNDEYANRLPAEWRATDATDTVLVICAETTTFGTPVRTCPYESTFSPLGYQDVTFRNVAIPVRIFELRTGQQIGATTVEIGGTSCPPILEYTYYIPYDTGPPSEVYVTPSDGDVHNGFRGLIDP